jgi:hypothetical protein
MKAIKALLIPGLAALGLAAVADAQAQSNPLASGAQSRAGSRIGAAVQGGGTRHFRHDGHRGGRHWRGDHRHRWHGHWGLYFGFPIAWSAWHWGWPAYDPFFYPYPRAYVYREVERLPEMGPAETTEISPQAEGAPTQGPLYMNYCESAKAYFPKVTSCPEGWKMTTPTN